MPRHLRKGEDLKASLMRFRDSAWRDPERTMLGGEQEAWLAGAFKRSAGQGTRWQLLAQQTVMGSLALPPEARSWLRADAPAPVKRATAIGAAASEVGLPLNLDAWDGYPAARDRLLRSALDADANLVVLSGDSHNGWAFDLDLAGAPAGAEFAGMSVTSPGLEAYVPGIAPAEVGAALRARNPALKWAEAPAPRLFDPDPDPRAGHRRMAVPGHGADPLHAARRAPFDERRERRQPLRLIRHSRERGNPGPSRHRAGQKRKRSCIPAFAGTTRVK